MRVHDAVCLSIFLRIVLRFFFSIIFVSCVCAQHVAMEVFTGNMPVLAEGLDLTEFGGRVALCPPPLSADNNSCTCPAGWTMLRGTCTVCAAGFFKAEAGFGACSACPAHMTSFEGAVDMYECLCDAGHMPDGGECVRCSSTTYKAFIGNNSCVSCPANTQTGSGATDMAHCLCHGGWTLVDDECVPCPENHFSGSLTSGACAPCPANSHSYAAASHCECSGGYARQGDGLCTPCVAGTYKESS